MIMQAQESIRGLKLPADLRVANLNGIQASYRRMAPGSRWFSYTAASAT